MLLIDGHNLIGKLPNISLGEPDDEAKPSAMGPYGGEKPGAVEDIEYWLSIFDRPDEPPAPTAGQTGVPS